MNPSFVALKKNVVQLVLLSIILSLFYHEVSNKIPIGSIFRALFQLLEEAQAQFQCKLTVHSSTDKGNT